MRAAGESNPLAQSGASGVGRLNLLPNENQDLNTHLPDARKHFDDALSKDELYGVLFVKPFTWLARVLWKVVDVLIIDGVLNAGAFLVELVGDILRFLQTGNVRNYALTFLIGIVALLLIVLAG